MVAVHSQDGRHFLGLRKARTGGYEIVYEAATNGRRLIWQIIDPNAEPDHLERQVHQAVASTAVLETLYRGLREAEIDFEVEIAQSWRRS